jgi:hypothetical protein
MPSYAGKQRATHAEALAGTGSPKKRTLPLEREPKIITGQIKAMPNLKGCRRGTGDDLNTSEMKLN